MKYILGSFMKIKLLVLLLLLLAAPSFAGEPLGKRIVLDNGMVLLLSEKHSLPMVTVNVLIKAGSVNDPVEKAGLASLTAGLLDEGTKTRTSTQISEEIDFVGGSLSSGGGDDYATAGLTILKKDLNLGMELLADIMVNPSFPEKEVQRKIRETMASIKKSEEDPASVASKAFAKNLFGEHPYGRPTIGTEETVQKITRDDVVGFYNSYFAPNRVIMAVVGDVTEEEIKGLLKKYFGEWKPKEVPAQTLPAAKSFKGRKVVSVDRDLTQTTILLGHLGVKRENPDFYALVVMNYILGGGGFSSRMMDNIRDNLGLAYGVDSTFSAPKEVGSFEVSMQTKNESANKAIFEVLKEIEMIRTHPVTDRELDDAKSYLTGSFPLRLDTNAKIARMLAGIELFNLGLDYVDKYPAYITAVTKEDVMRVAKQYLSVEDYLLVVVGNQEKAQVK
ncbi:MAG: insulinase family protein [Nitrospirota bacterium]|nr:insulinase family protein [Nitrospirota bacterium]